MSSRQRVAADYTVACICPMGVELAPVEAMLDEIHHPLPISRGQNAYTLGHIGSHNLVVAIMPEIGNNAAAAVAVQLWSDFPSIRFALLVGIGGGVPCTTDVRLGDVVVSRPTDTFGGVVQYDFGRTLGGGRFQRTGLLNKPPQVLNASVKKLEGQYLRKRHRLLNLIEEMLERYPSMRDKYTYPAVACDVLFKSHYSHVSGTDCGQCDQQQIVDRPTRQNHEPHIHYGTIGSANSVLKDAALRDELGRDMNLMCVEMEAAGLINDFPCLVIRGICDYADSHKNKQWQPYAAAVAAAYMKELLSIIPIQPNVRLSHLPSSSHAVADDTGAVVRQDDHDKIDDDILASLAFPQMRDRRQDVHEPHHNTCRWILELETYRQWDSLKHGLLWIKGKPGAGKSTVMSYLYGTFRDRPKTDHEIRIEYFFSARGVQLQYTVLGMLRSLLNQIFQYTSESRIHIRKYFREKCASYGCQVGTWEWHERELQSLLLESILTVAQCRQVLIFVDALDEAGETAACMVAEYFHKIHDQVAATLGNAKICISCRHYPIVSIAGGLEVTVENHNHADIAAYVQDRFKLMHGDIGDNDNNSREWRPLQDDLTQRTNGVFQWICIVMAIVEKNFKDGLSAEEIQSEIQKLPEKISEIYEHILLNVISPALRSQSFLLFQWTCLAEESLSVTQMRYALAATQIVPQSRFSPSIRCNETAGFIKNDSMMRQRVLALSGGLIEVVDDRIQVGHQTVKEFLMYRGLGLLAQFYTITDNGPFAPQHSDAERSGSIVVLQNCHSRLYWSCLKYLATEMVVVVDFEDEWYHPPERRHKLLADSPLIEYATRNVFVHAKKAEQHRAQGTSDQVELIQRVMTSWISVYRLFDRYSPQCPERGTALIHLAANFGLDDIVESLLQERGFCGQLDGKDQNALHLAARQGHSTTMQLLIKARFDVNQRTTDGNTPLTLAAANGHLRVTQILLQNGAHLDGSSTDAGDALQAAVLGGQLQVVWVFLEAGANVNAQGGQYGNALQAASFEGSENAVRMLLEAGAEVNAQGGRYGNALQAASLDGPETVVRILLEAGADVNAQGGHYGNALQAASYMGSENVVRMLLEAGADVNAQGGYYGNALQTASYMGSEDVLRMLLDAGAEINIPGLFGTALHAASSFNYPEKVRILIDRGADVNLQVEHQKSAVKIAQDEGYDEVVQLLLDAGATT